MKPSIALEDRLSFYDTKLTVAYVSAIGQHGNFSNWKLNINTNNCVWKWITSFSQISEHGNCQDSRFALDHGCLDDSVLKQ